MATAMPKSSRVGGRALRVLGAVPSALSIATTASALHTETPGLVRLTTDTSNVHRLCPWTPRSVRARGDGSVATSCCDFRPGPSYLRMERLGSNHA